MPAGRLARALAGAGAAGVAVVLAAAVAGAVPGSAPPAPRHPGGARGAAGSVAHRMRPDALAAPLARIPLGYHQGIAVHGDDVWFSGPAVGLTRTDRSLRVRAATADAIPATVQRRDGYDHVGAIAYDRGRLLLPLECYPATCRTGAIGVAGPRTLRWRYAVRLDPAAVGKAMWVALTPDGGYVVTSAGTALLGFRAGDLTAAHAWPAHGAIGVAWRRPGVLPLGVTGAAFAGDRLVVATQTGGGRPQLWSVDPAGGARRLLRTGRAGEESEGVAVTGGRIAHWELQPRRVGPLDLLRPVGRLLRVRLR